MIRRYVRAKQWPLAAASGPQTELRSASEKSSHERGHEQDKEDEEQYLGNFSCTNRNASKPKHGGDDRYDKKYGGVMKHLKSLLPKRARVEERPLTQMIVR